MVAVEFDGKVCEENSPGIGKEKPMVLMSIKPIQSLGVYTLIWTCRSGKDLKNAINWCVTKGLEFDKYNEHADCFLSQFDCLGPKIGADMYIDDKAHSAHQIKDLKDIAKCYSTSVS